jgi:autophagy-related protein 9
MSYPFASRYLDQFPKVKMVKVARFMAFVAGAVVSVLAVATLWDPEIFLGFEITSDRTVLFYLTLFGGIWAVMNGTIPEENLVFEPEYALRNVIEYTHYMPNHWQGRLHSDEVPLSTEDCHLLGRGRKYHYYPLYPLVQFAEMQ